MRLRPGVHLFQTKDYQEEMRTNSLGTVNFEASFSGYRHLVFAIGDSYTQGTGLPADASYPFQLSLTLNVDASGLYRRLFGVVNLGLGAYGTTQEGLVLERYAKILRPPDVVLYLGSDNDYDDDLLFRAGYRHTHLVEGNPRWGPAFGVMARMTEWEIFKRVKYALGTYRHGRIIKPPASAALLVKGETAPSVAELVWPEVKRIVEYCRAHRILIIVSWAADSSASYDWLKAKAASDGLGFADWRPSVDSILTEIPSLPVNNNHSGGHFRSWLNRLVAEAYAREIKKHFLASSR